MEKKRKLGQFLSLKKKKKKELYTLNGLSIIY